MLDSAVWTLGAEQRALLDFCTKDAKRVILMPAGAHAVEVYENHLKPLGVECAYFVDNNAAKHGSFLSDIEVISFEKLLTLKEDVKIVLATNLEIYAILQKQVSGFGIESFYAAQQYSIYSVEEIFTPHEILRTRHENYVQLYTLLEDSLSKKTLDNHLLFRCDYTKQAYIDAIQQDAQNQYFEDDIYKISAKDSIVDCGAYTGDTYENASQRIQGCFKNYYAFEPDAKNFALLQSRHGEHIQAYNAGCFSEEKRFFSGSCGTSACKIQEKVSETYIDVVALDVQLRGKEVSFIKMDIEGAEMEALKGAKQIIQSQSPTLAISVYHRFHDIFTIPALIQSYSSAYSFYLRHYTNYISETILYAVKKA